LGLNRGRQVFQGVRSIDSTETPADGLEYQTWEQVAGYFDGDGNVRVDLRKFVLRIGVRFSDTWKPQLEAIQRFLLRRGIRTSAVGIDKDRLGNRRPAYRLDINETLSVIELLDALAVRCVKKHEDLRIALDYLRDRITGAEAIQRLNEQVRIGRRRGHLHSYTNRLTRSAGHRLYELTNARIAREAHIVRIGPELQKRIKDDQAQLGLSIVKLSKKYGYSESVIRRVLGRR
jgi:LAGLIDADG-like domain